MSLRPHLFWYQMTGSAGSPNLPLAKLCVPLCIAAMHRARNGSKRLIVFAVLASPTAPNCHVSSNTQHASLSMVMCGTHDTICQPTNKFADLSDPIDLDASCELQRACEISNSKMQFPDLRDSNSETGSFGRPDWPAIQKQRAEGKVPCCTGTLVLSQPVLARTRQKPRR
jgi:hypothetical protein